MHKPQPSIRPAVPGDFDELWRIDQECFEPGISYSQAELTHYMRRRGAFTLVAELGKRIAGFVVAERHRELGHIITIDVRAAARRAGLGSRLMSAAEEQLLAAGCSAVYLETAVNNTAAISFYLRRGYTVLKTIPRYYQGKLDAFLMGKELGVGSAGG